MTRMLVIITAALITVWFPSQAARIAAQAPALRIEAPQSAHGLLLQNRFAGTALR